MRKMLVTIFCLVILALPACAARKCSDDPQANKIFAPYMEKMQKDLKATWTPPVNNTSKISKIVFEIDKEGTVRSKEVTLPSRDNSFDKSVDETAAKVQFPPLPSTYREDSARFTIMFKRDVKY